MTFCICWRCGICVMILKKIIKSSKSQENGKVHTCSSVDHEDFQKRPLPPQVPSEAGAKPPYTPPHQEVPPFVPEKHPALLTRQAHEGQDAPPSNNLNNPPQPNQTSTLAGNTDNNATSGQPTTVSVPLKDEGLEG